MQECCAIKRTIILTPNATTLFSLFNTLLLVILVSHNKLNNRKRLSTQSLHRNSTVSTVCFTVYYGIIYLGGAASIYNSQACMAPPLVMVISISSLQSTKTYFLRVVDLSIFVGFN
jgi:hypothetical protein